MGKKTSATTYKAVRHEIPALLSGMLTIREMAKRWGVSYPTANRYVAKYREEVAKEQKESSSLALSILEGKKRILDEAVRNFIKAVSDPKNKLKPSQLADMAVKTMNIYEQFEKTANRFGFIDPEVTKQELSGLPTKINVYIPEEIRKRAEEQIKKHSQDEGKIDDTETQDN